MHNHTKNHHLGCVILESNSGEFVQPITSSFWGSHLYCPLDFRPEPDEVAVPAATPELLDLERRQVRPHAHLVVGEPLVAHPVGPRARHLDLEEVGYMQMKLLSENDKRGMKSCSPGGL